MLSNLGKLSSTNTKGSCVHIGGKISELHNQMMETLARDMIRLLLKNMSRYHHHHHVTPLFFRCATHLLHMYH